MAHLVSDSTAPRMLDWGRDLQLFLEGRLQTVPYRVASRSNPLVELPNLPMNTQYLIDGVVAAIADHGVRFAGESLRIVVSHLGQAWGRWDDVRRRLEEVHAATQHMSEHRRATQFRYAAHAAMQDVLLSWYVVDAVLKSRSSGHELAQDELVRPLLQQLPSLCSRHMPVFCAQSISSGSPYIAGAVEDYRLLFLQVLQSWTLPQPYGLPLDCQQRCSDFMAQRLRTIADDVAQRHRNHRGAALSEDLVALLQSAYKTEGGAAAGPAHHSSFPQRTFPVPGGRGRGHFRSRQEQAQHYWNRQKRGKDLVNFFIDQAFTFANGRFYCIHCGAPFSNMELQQAHHRSHFLMHEQRDKDPAVRMRFPSADEFAQHVPVDWRARDATPACLPKLFCRTTEAYRPNFVPKVPVLVQADATGKLSGSQGQRSRGVVGVVVPDISAAYRCARCREPIQPIQDPLSKEWVLEGCVDVPGGVGICHKGCITN